jgi:ureidoacrylate peracid hydrolase
LREVTERRGRLHLFDALDPRTSALVAIDLQNTFVAPGAPLEVPRARTIVPNVNALARGFRAAGAPVVWVRMIADAPEAWPSRARMLDPRLAAAANASMQPGHHGHELWPALEVQPGDLHVDKRRYSAFLPVSSNIDTLLRERGVQTIVVTGTTSNVCCESSARDAMMLGYDVLFVSDATAALTDAAHLSALCSIMTVFGDVLTTAEVLDLLAPRVIEARAGGGR